MDDLFFMTFLALYYHAFYIKKASTFWVLAFVFTLFGKYLLY